MLQSEQKNLRAPYILQRTKIHRKSPLIDVFQNSVIGIINKSIFKNYA